MGLSIHYSGSITNPALLPELITEVSDIAEALNWKYSVFEREFPENAFRQDEYNAEKIYGLAVTPPQSEPVWLCFLSNGRMSNPLLLQLWGNSHDEEEMKYLYMPFTKTQFAGMEVHRIVIQLFRHIENKYLAGFSMLDEGSYWETNDEEVLRQKFIEYDFILDAFSDSLNNKRLRPGETLEDFVNRIALEVHKKLRTEKDNNQQGE